ncbi:MAG: sigma 54-interacting transcriptional regulator [Acidobacteriota bacterium]
MRPRLVGLTGPLEGRTWELGVGSLSIGRHASNDLVLREIAMSRHHAVIEGAEDGFHLRDLESRHGVSINGEAVTRHRLAHGELIGLCRSTLLFLLHEVEPDTGPVCLDDSTVLTDSTLALDITEPMVSKPESILVSLPPEGHSAPPRRERALSVLLRAGSGLVPLRRLGDLAEHLLRLALEAVPAERAALLLATPGGGRFEPAFALAEGGELVQPVAVSQTVTLRVLRQQVALLSNDVRRAADLAAAESLQAARVGAVLCVPLLTLAASSTAPRSLGVLYLDDSRSDTDFGEEDLRILTALAGMAAPAVANLRHLAWVEGERRRLQSENLDHDMIGESPAMAKAVAMIARVARTDTTVLMRGESGTGKELAAQAVHRGGVRRERPFVAINCATLEGNLLESELFGHEKGAFTGASARKAGKLEVADTGTVFLDEVGELPLTTQAKLLRVLQEREFERVGGTRSIRIDVRVLAATNRDLEAAIRQGSFREDLFYRLNVVAITLPPLRQRRSDIPLLASHFAALHARRLKRSVPRFSPATQNLLERYDWPGNVRELTNAIERALVLCPDNVVRPEDLPEALLETSVEESLPPVSGYHEVLRDTKKSMIKQAVREAQGNITQAAKALDLHPNYLHRLIKNLDLRSELL